MGQQSRRTGPPQCHPLVPKSNKVAGSGSLPPLALAASLLAITAPAMAGAPFLADDADTPDQGHYEIDVALQYTRFQGGAFGAAPSLAVDYGVTDHLQIAAMVPYAFGQTDGAGSNFGIGDSQVGLKYRFVDADEDGWRPGIAFEPTLIAPSGSAARGLGAGRTQAFLPVWLSKEFAPVTVFGGGGPTINAGAGNRTGWFAGLGALDQLSPQWSVGAEVYNTTPLTARDRDSAGFNLAVIYSINDNHHLLFAIGRNVVNGSANQLSTYIGYQLTF